MQCTSCGEEMGRLEIEPPPGCDDIVFRAYCKACEYAERDEPEPDQDGNFDADELGIDPEEDVAAWRS